MSKFTTDKIPNMRPKEKPKKMGLLTSKNRRNMTMRLQVETIERLERLLGRCRLHINPRISRTDIMEALVLNCDVNQTNTDLKKMLIALGLGKE